MFKVRNRNARFLWNIYKFSSKGSRRTSPDIVLVPSEKQEKAFVKFRKIHRKKHFCSTLFLIKVAVVSYYFPVNFVALFFKFREFCLKFRELLTYYFIFNLCWTIILTSKYLTYSISVSNLIVFSISN